MMIGLYVMIALILILTWIQAHKLAAALFVLNLLLCLALFWHHVTEKIPVNF